MSGDASGRNPAGERLPAFLSLGSNVGNREEFLHRARQALERHPRMHVVRCSSVYENPAILYEEQDDFLNQIVEVESDLSPLELLDFLLETEQRLGRQRRFRKGPREIDLDILTYGALTLNTEKLTLPHPGLFDRAYIHTLLAELGESVETIT